MYKEFAKLLKEKQKTAYQVSRETGISQTAFSNWKTGRTSPNLDSITKLASYFDVPIEYFIEDKLKQRDKLR